MTIGILTKEFFIHKSMQQDSDFKLFGLLAIAVLSSFVSAFLLIAIVSMIGQISGCFPDDPTHGCAAILPIVFLTVITCVGLLILSSWIAFKTIKKLKRFPLPDVPSPRQ